MEPKINSLAAELAKLEEVGHNAQQNGDPVDMAVGIGVIEAVTQARLILNEAKAEAEIAKELASSLSGFTQLVPSLLAVHDQLAKTDGQLSAVALAYQSGTEKQQAAFSADLEKHSASLQHAIKILSEYQASAEKRQENGVAKTLEATKAAITNLIQEIEGGVKVEIANQAKLPVVGFTKGAVKSVDQAIPVMLVDEYGTPVKGGVGGGTKFAGGGASYVGPTNTNTIVDPLAEYRSADQDEAGSPMYYGFLTADGRWYIMSDTGSAQRYFKGTNGGYVAAWTGRAGLAYDYFDVIF